MGRQHNKKINIDFELKKKLYYVSEGDGYDMFKAIVYADSPKEAMTMLYKDDHFYNTTQRSDTTLEEVLEGSLWAYRELTEVEKAQWLRKEDWKQIKKSLDYSIVVSVWE